MTETIDIYHEESFRDSVATISSDGKRNFINPKKPRGRLFKLRTWFSIFYLVVFLHCYRTINRQLPADSCSTKKESIDQF